MVCNKCGKEVSADNDFCVNCGNKMPKNVENNNQHDVDLPRLKQDEMQIVSLKEEIVKVEPKVEEGMEIKYSNNEEVLPVVEPVVEEKTEVLISSEQERNVKPKKKRKIWILAIIIVGILLLIFLGLLIFNSIEPKRAGVLTSIEKKEQLSFKINDTMYYIGDKVTNFTNNGINFDSNFVKDLVYGDSISSRSFADEKDNTLFIGALYCPTNENCKHADTILVKANFYEDSKVIVNDYVKFNMKYEEVVEKYGKEKGRFYQDNSLYVWTFDDENKVGSPYMVLRFDDSWLSWSSGINEIRLGVFWYEGEAEHIIVPEKNTEVEGEK